MWVPDPDADELRFRTERFLLGCAAAAVPGALRLAEALGVLCAEEAEAWRARWSDLRGDEPPGHRVIRPPDEPVAPLPAAARERLDALLAELAAHGPGASDSAAWWALQAQAGVLQRVGLLGREEAQALDDRAAELVGLARTRYAPEREMELVDVWPGPPSTGDARFVELRRYTRALEVVWIDPSWGRDRPPDPFEHGLGDRFMGLEVSDDAGTEYRPGSGGGSPEERHVELRPAPPPEARRLRLAAGDAVWEVALR